MAANQLLTRSTRAAASVGNTQEIVQCGCGRSYTRWKYHSRPRRTVCPSCRTSIANAKRTGARNSSWKGGHKYWLPGRYGQDKDGLSWKRQRQLCRERDNYTCQDCQKHMDELGHMPHCDHEIPFRVSLSHALDNLRLRCRVCHARADSQRPQLWGGHALRPPPTPRTRPRCSRCGKLRVLVGGLCKSCQRTTILIPKAIQLRQLGLSYAEIAKTFGLTHGAVWHWLNDGGCSVEVRTLACGTRSGGSIPLIHPSQTELRSTLSPVFELSGRNGGPGYVATDATG